MGAGKSTIGPRLAQQLGWSFIDLDDEIVRTEQKSIAQIFDSVGEARFRELEHDALANTLRLENIVLALGGGAIETDANRQRLHDDKGTILLYLAASLEILIERCEQQQLQSQAVRRPILEKRAELADRFQRRRPFYEMADWTLETSDQSLDQIVATILALLDKASWNTAQESQRRA
jgi:shikimate kinase